MITNLGDYLASSTVYFMYNTTDQGGSSVAPTADGAIRIYKNASTTQRSSQAGITLDNNFDTADLGDGVQHVTVDTSDNTDAGFYAAGNDYFIILDTATIDGETVSAVLAMFSIENRTVNADRVASDSTAAANLAAGANAVISGAFSGTPSTTTAATDLSGYAADALIGRYVYVTSGTYKGQASLITDYVVAAATLTYETLPAGAPSSTDSFIIA